MKAASHQWIASPNIPFLLLSQKPGKWCAMHVRVAYMILRHQEKMKVGWACAASPLRLHTMMGSGPAPAGGRQRVTTSNGRGLSSSALPMSVPAPGCKSGFVSLGKKGGCERKRVWGGADLEASLTKTGCALCERMVLQGARRLVYGGFFFFSPPPPQLMQGDAPKLDFRNDLLTCLPGTGAFGSLHNQELARPATLFTTSGECFLAHPGGVFPGPPLPAFLPCASLRLHF